MNTPQDHVLGNFRESMDHSKVMHFWWSLFNEILNDPEARVEVLMARHVGDGLNATPSGFRDRMKEASP